MAPALIDIPQDTGAERIYVKTQLQDGYKEAFAQGPKTTNYDNELKGVGKHPPAKYPNYLPVWDNEKDIGGKYPPNQPFEAYEHGIDADPSFQNLLRGATSVEDLTANIGAEVKGIQLSKLDKAGKDELALFVAQKKVVGKQYPQLILPATRTLTKTNQLSAIKTLQTYQSKKPKTLPNTSAPHTSTQPPAHPRASQKSTWYTGPPQTQPPKITSRSARTA
jgi:hypothetical protein